MKPKSGFVIIRDYKLPRKDLVVTHVWSGITKLKPIIGSSMRETTYVWTANLEKAKIYKGVAGKKEARITAIEIRGDTIYDGLGAEIRVAHVSWIKLAKNGRIRCSASLNPKYRTRKVL